MERGNRNNGNVTIFKINNCKFVKKEKMTNKEKIEDYKKKAQNKSLPASAVAALNKMIADLEKSEEKKGVEKAVENLKEKVASTFKPSSKGKNKGLKPKFKIGDIVDVIWGEEVGKKGKVTKVYSHELYPKSIKIEDAANYEIEGMSKNIPEDNLKISESKKETKSEDKKETSGKKIKLKEIKIHWAEGDNSKYDKFPKMYSTWSKANEAIIPVLKDNKYDGGYNKVKFTAFYEDGETYDGRLDVSEEEDNPTKTHNVIGQHIKDFLDYQLSEKSKSSAESKKEIKEWLEKYDLGLSSSKETVKSEDKKETKSEKTEEERCQEIIDKQRIASKKAKAAAKKSAKKPEVTKAKEKIERTFEVIENKIEKGALTKAEVAKLIVETKEVLKMLEKALKSL
jgi:hypothetical protein